MNAPRIFADVETSVTELMAGWRPEFSAVVRGLARHLDDSRCKRAIASTGMEYSTALSRFARAGLATPKEIHTALRIYAYLRLMETPGVTISAAAYHLGCSSPQAWGRTLRQQIGYTARRVVNAVTADVWWQRVVTQIIRPTDPAWTGHSARSCEQAIAA